MKRCTWCNLNNEIYVNYHDKEWGNPCFDEQYLFEMLIFGVKMHLNTIKYGADISSLFFAETGANHHILWGFY